jgi:hypothetical protein
MNPNVIVMSKILANKDTNMSRQQGHKAQLSNIEAAKVISC